MTVKGEEAGDRLSAEAGGSLTELEIKGAGCTVAGKYAVSGEIITPFTPVDEMTKAATQRFPGAAITEWWNNESSREKKAYRADRGWQKRDPAEFVHGDAESG